MDLPSTRPDRADEVAAAPLEVTGRTDGQGVGANRERRGFLSSRRRVFLFALVAILYLAVPNARPDFTRFNAHDSESYLMLAWNLAHGRGYTLSADDRVYVPHTTWPPGTPALMVPAALISARTINWYAVKWTMCLVALAGVLLTWFYLRDVTGKVWVADAGALLLGLNPFYWDFGHQAMAEVPLTVMCIASLYLVHRVWSRSTLRLSRAFWVGLVSGLSMLFKGHGAALVFVPIAYLIGRRRSGWLLSTGVAAYVCFIVGFSVPQAAWMLRKQTVQATGFNSINHFKSFWAVDPNDVTSRLATPLELVERAVRNVRLYAVYRPAEQIVPGFWSDVALGWKGSGWVALLLSAAILALAFRPRSDVMPVSFVAGPIILLNVAYALGGAARFWVPVSSLLLIAIAISVSRSAAPGRRLRLAGAVILFANLGAYAVQHERHPYDRVTGPWRQRAELYQAIADRSDLHVGNVFTANAAAFRLMTGFRAPDANDSVYDHAVVDLEHTLLPVGARIVVSKPPLAFVALPEPLPRPALQKALRR